jgi:Cd2+/Zn2+-exporting ATPase
MIIKEYEIKNLDCAGCSAKIEGEIANLAEVNSVNLDFFNKRLIVQYNQDAENALERLNQIASGIEPGVAILNKGDKIAKPKSFYAQVIYAGLALWLIAKFAPISPAMVLWMMIAAYLMVAGRVLHSALKEVFSKQLLAEHFLMSIASLGAVYLGEYTEAIAVIALYELGQYLETKAITRSRNTISGMMSLSPEQAHVKSADGVVDRKLNLVNPGDILVVHPGERIPLDGRIVKGESSLDTSSVSGESAPLSVTIGDEIFAGCLNQSGLLEMETTQKEADSMVARILALIDNASARKSRQERFITRFARIYTPVVVALAIMVFVVPVLLGYPAAVWFKRALVFLIVSCPCALVISIPLTYYIGIGLAARKGIIFKGSVFLDGLRQTSVMVFDKTGTITTGKLKLEELHTAQGRTEAELREALAIAEAGSKHPYALAVNEVLRFSISPEQITDYKEIPGKGIRMNYANVEYLAGSENFLREAGFTEFEDPGDRSCVHVAKSGVYLGAASFSDEIKPGMLHSLIELRKLGVQSMYMLSGDRWAKAKAVSTELNLDGFKAELLPAEKLGALEEIMTTSGGKTAFIGDGMNDAPVLARADIGIAMGAIGAQASIDSADVVLLNDKPEQIVHAYLLSRAVNRKVWQNIILALGIKILVMVLGVAGISGLWEAIIADVGVTLLVIFNSLSLSRLNSRLDKN